jgi:Fe-S-cluster containining protein
LFVEATEPEIFLIAREIRKGAPEEVQAILETLRVRAAVTKDDAKNLRRRDCAFLKNKRCSIYEVRPSTCRKAHSLSAESCGNFASEIPQKLEILLGAEALIQGTADAYRQLKLHASAHELCNAVLLALSDDTAEARWYNGETVFPRDGA